MLAELERVRHLLHSAAGDAWFARDRFPQKEVNIRGVGESFAIFQTGKKRPLGSVDGHRALRECHPGAVYLHKAQSWAVERLDLERHNVWVNPIEPNYFTRIQTRKRDGNPGDHGDPPGGGLYGPHRPAQGHRTHHVL